MDFLGLIPAAFVEIQEIQGEKVAIFFILILIGLHTTHTFRHINQSV